MAEHTYTLQEIRRGTDFGTGAQFLPVNDITTEEGHTLAIYRRLVGRLQGHSCRDRRGALRVADTSRWRRPWRANRLSVPARRAGRRGRSRLLPHPIRQLEGVKPAMTSRPLDQLVDEAIGAVLPGFDQMDWADDEIEKAAQRHPAAADTIFHSFGLLNSQHDVMTTSEHLYRAHCREILDRVAFGQDTRPGTAAEIIAACRATSLLSPLTSAASGLYGRMWSEAFPDWTPPLGDQHQDHYEAIKGDVIDDHETDARRRLAVPDRRSPAHIECNGRHHAETVNCRYAPIAQLAATQTGAIA